MGCQSFTPSLYEDLFVHLANGCLNSCPLCHRFSSQMLSAHRHEFTCALSNSLKAEMLFRLLASPNGFKTFFFEHFLNQSKRLWQYFCLFYRLNLVTDREFEK